MVISNIKTGDYNLSSFALESVFWMSCSNGQLDIAIWLYIISETNNMPIDLTANDCSAFRIACNNGHFHIVQWLYETAKNEGKQIQINNVYTRC